MRAWSNLAPEETRLKVWVDQDLCTGDGLCEEIAPEIFVMHDDGLSYVKESGEVLLPGGTSSMVTVPDSLAESVKEAAAECPGECIFIESTSSTRP